MLFCISYLWDALYNCICVFQWYVCETTRISIPTSCSRHIDVVSMLVHKLTMCQSSCVLCTPMLVCIIHEHPHPVMWLWQVWQTSRKTKEHQSFVQVCLSPLTSVGIWGEVIWDDNRLASVTAFYSTVTTPTGAFTEQWSDLFPVEVTGLPISSLYH